ncbi:hypothetical protein K502DRAFT_354157 [Neoconidiobolus thromboides FSU 785]|nr:hypothetical protein K502DRAFT_354157 [Neoconidiobolus thromboides FSU 785]
MQASIVKLRNGIFKKFDIVGKNTLYNVTHLHRFNAVHSNQSLWDFIKNKKRKEKLPKFTIDNNKLNQVIYKISALRETDKNQQVALLSTIFSLYSFDKCKSFESNISRNQYDHLKVIGNNNTLILQPIIENTEKIKDEQIKIIIRYGDVFFCLRILLQSFHSNSA